MSKLHILMLSCALVSAAAGGTEMDVRRLTTVLYTDDVDGCAAWWVERVGFEQTMAVPAQQAGQTGNQFVGLANGALELMIQSYASQDEEMPGLIGRSELPPFILFVEVDSREALMARFADSQPAVAPRETFYGSREVGYRDPCGTLVVFAEFPPQAEGAEEEGSGPDG